MQIETSSSRWTEFSSKALWEEFQEEKSIGSNRNVYSNKIPGDSCVFDPNLYCNIFTKAQTFYCGKLISDKTFTYRAQRGRLWFSCSHFAVGKRIISKKGSTYTIATPAKTPLKHRKRNTFREVDTKTMWPVLTTRYQQLNERWGLIYWLRIWIILWVIKSEHISTWQTLSSILLLKSFSFLKVHLLTWHSKVEATWRRCNFIRSRVVESYGLCQQ